MFYTILWPFMWLVSWVIFLVHKGLTFLGFGEGSGAAWPLSIIGLVIIVRLLILPLFNKQLRSAQLMQQVAPEIKKIQARYKGKKDPVSQRRMMEETQAVYREAGTSPFASCLPLLVQMPIFFALFNTLRDLILLDQGTLVISGKNVNNIGAITQQVAHEILNSHVITTPLSDTFIGAFGVKNWSSVLVTGFLIVVMALTQFISMKHITMKNMTTPDAGEGGQAAMMAMMQKGMIYFAPVMLLFSGVMFPLGVVIYWFTNNLWSLGQQAYMVRNHPNKGTEAWDRKMERERQKRIKKGLPPEEPKNAEEILNNMPRGQRVQPVGKKRAKKAKNSAVAPEEMAANLAAANAQREVEAREQAEFIAMVQQVKEELLTKGKEINLPEVEKEAQNRLDQIKAAAAKKAQAKKKKS